MDRYLCVHGHFYQPPRENPWLEAIELQDSAYPYHDWNERITAECYAPNSASRILDDRGRIVKVVNNYAQISFNFGPTLLQWMADKAPGVYHEILSADADSQDRFGGHGSAIAQAYNHMILPLANARDKLTQVLWGIRDFEHRFGRRPEGMWLPEAAVDLASLAVLAEQGIAYTVLAPYQARRVRPIGGTAWVDVAAGGVDPTMPYLLRLPGANRSITLFFYDGPLSRAVAFEGLLSNGEHFARRLMTGFDDQRQWPQLVHIATDGESYGHHHRHGDMALAYALEYVERNQLAKITNYGQFLDHVTPTHEVQLSENTSWSCAHGVERWRADCGCNTGGGPNWTQLWRGPLREALDWLRDELAPRYEEVARQFLADPWLARDDYVAVVLDRGAANVEAFLDRHARRPLQEVDKVAVLKLLELQRHAMLMYTSCGWFFDELSGLEPVQVLQYAARAIQLAAELFGDDLEPRFLDLLARAPSNLPELHDGRHVYQKYVAPAGVDLEKVGAHYAISSLFETYPKQAQIYGYTADREDYQRFEAGRANLVVGRATIHSRVTWESARLSFGVLHFGDHNLTGGVRPFRDDTAYQALVDELTEPFSRADFPAVIRLQDKHFGAPTYSLRSLFRDEQRHILRRILDGTLAESDSVYRQLYEHHVPLMRFITDLGVPLPRALHTAAEFVVNADLGREFRGDAEAEHVGRLLTTALTWHLDLDATGLAYTLERALDAVAEALAARPANLTRLERFEQMVAVARTLPFEVKLWTPQNVVYEMLQSSYPFFRGRAEQGDAEATTWARRFRAVAEHVGVRIE
jgi:alpha-amylase/alpha-mannosidase (GH57 family)